MNKFINIAAALVISMPLLAQAQNAPQAGAIVASAPGEAAVAHSIQVQGKVKSIDKKSRTVVIVGAEGKEVAMVVGEDARNFKQLRVGDLVTLTYVQALALELLKVDNKVVSERVESEQTVRTKLGEKPGGVVQRTIHAVAEVVAVDQKAETITLRGPKQTLELAVNNPAQLKEIKVGNQVEVVYVEAIGLEVTATKKQK